MEGWDEGQSHPNQSLGDSSASGIWDPTYNGWNLPYNGWSLVQCYWDPGYHPQPSDFTSKSLIQDRSCLHCLAYIPLVLGSSYKIILLDFLPLPLSFPPLFPNALHHDTNALLVQDLSIVQKTTGSSALGMSLWILKCIPSIFNQSFM